MGASEGLAEMFALFDSESKSDVVRIARTAIISSADLGNLLLYAGAYGGLPPYHYARHFRMSSIMRWRKGETLGLSELMVRLQSKSEADRLTRQLGRTFSAANNQNVAGASTARAV